MGGLDFTVEGFLKGLEALSKGITTDDLSFLCEVHQRVLDIKNLIQDTLDLQTNYFYIEENGKFKIEIEISTHTRTLSPYEMDIISSTNEFRDEIEEVSSNKKEELKETSSKKSLTDDEISAIKETISSIEEILQMAKDIKKTTKKRK